ncbi:ligand-gated ion channel domain-containing protein [Phthorimaea operculella]|nr:ligand-gated ion channel domain-containing protein [Phthorimaea operculella]
MAAKIALYNYEWRFNTFVVFNVLHLVSIEAFFTHYNAVLVKKGKYVLVNRVDHVPQFVLFGYNSYELGDICQWLMENKYDNTAKFIIVCVSTDVEDCDEQAIMQTLGELSIANVVFLKLTEDFTPEGYTVYPLRPNKCWNKEPVKINELTYGCVKDRCYENLFPEKYWNLYQCPISIATFEQPPYMSFENDSNGEIRPVGSDGDTLRLVTNMLNGSLSLKIPEEKEWGHYRNNNWTGCLGEVYNNRAHGAMCSTPLTVAKYGNFQISFTYDSMDLVWGASLPAEKPSWEKLLYPLPVFLRLILLFMFIVIICMNSFMKTKFWNNVMKVLGTKTTRSNLLIYTWIIFLGMPVAKIPRKFPFRLVLFSWLYYCFLIRTLYQATLVGSLKLRIYDKRLEKFSDVLAKKYPFGGQQSLREYFSEDRNVYENWQSISHAETDEMLDKITKGESDFVIAMNRESIFAHLMKHRGTRQVQILPEKIVNSPSVIFFKKNSHICAPVSKFLTVQIEGGFSQRLYGEYTRHMKNLLRQPDSPAEPLQLQHFFGSFVLLMLGWLLGAIFFGIELACGTQITKFR